MKKMRKPLSVLLSVLMAFSVLSVGFTVGASAEGDGLTLLGRYFTTDDRWAGVGWQSGGWPAIMADGSTYIDGSLKITNEDLFSGVTADTGLTISYTYTPLQSENYRHLLSLGLNAENNTEKHLYISANPSHIGGGKIPVIGYVSGGEHINASPNGGPAFQVGRTYDITIAISKTDIKYYIDGVQYNSDKDNDSATYLEQFLNEVSTYKNNYVGLSRWSDTDLNAYIYDLRFYRGVATSAYDTKLADAETAFASLSAADFSRTAPYSAAISINKDGSSEQIGSGFYSNIVYADPGETDFSGQVDKFYMKNKMVTPSQRVVLVYDGTNETSAPIEFESRVGTKHENVLHALKSNSGVMGLSTNWTGYMSGGYQTWSGQHLDWDGDGEVRYQFSYRNNGDQGVDPTECKDKFGNNAQQDNTGTSRFWYNKLYYLGTGNTESYFDRAQNISFQEYGSYTEWGSRHYENAEIGTTSDYYIINNKPVYQILNTGATAKIDGVTGTYKAIDVFNEISAHAAYYTEESLAQAKAALVAVAKADPSRFAYAKTDYEGYAADTAATAALHGASFAGNATKVAAQMFGQVDLVKKTATIRFENFDGALLDSVTLKYGETPAYSGTPAKTADETNHYAFTGWSPAIAEVSGDRTYTATYSGTAHSGGTATCLEKKECTVCHTRYGELADHSYGTLNPQIDATCTEDGTKAYYECSVCHNYFDEQHEQITDGLTIVSEGHQLVPTAAEPSTCTTKGHIAYWTCSECGLIFDSADASHSIALAETVLDYNYNNHSTSETEIDESTAFAAGCLTAGYSGDICCKACHHKIADGATIPPQGHSLTGHPATVSTCSTHGNSAYWTCSRCNGVFSDSEGEHATLLADTVLELDYTNHSTTETVFDAETARAATCAAAGYTGDRLCAACGRRVAAGDPIEKLQHTYGEGEVVTAATCSAQGEMKYVCSECGDIKTEPIEIDANAHAWVYTDDGETHSRICSHNGAHMNTGMAHNDEPIETVYATTESDGHIKYRCRDCGHEHTETLPQLEHPFGPWVDDENGSTHTRTATDGSGVQENMPHRWEADAAHSVPADCGHNEKLGEKCKDCGAVRQVEQPGTATGNHSWTKTGETAGDCVTPSVISSECSVCGQTKTENGEKDMTKHVGEQVVRNARDADCNNEGYTGDVYCSACDTLLSTGSVSPRTSHEWELTAHTSENPCVRAGTNTYTCVHCGEIRTLFEPAKGHQFPEWETTAEPSCTEKGSETRACSACGEIETRDIPALGHVDADRDGKCDRCEIEWKDPDAPDYVFRCSHCDVYEAHRDIPVIGIFYALVHFFIHYGQLIGVLSSIY